MVSFAPGFHLGFEEFFGGWGRDGEICGWRRGGGGIHGLGTGLLID